MRGRPTPLLLALAVALVIVALLATGVGAYEIPVGQVLGSVLHKVGIDTGSLPDHLGERTLWEVRFPRVVLGALVGASLGCAGALMQGVFGNPLAEPGVIGVSSGAAVGAAAVVVSGVSFLGSWTVVAAAFFGGLIAVAVVYALSRANGRTEVVTLVLTGVAVNALCGAMIGLLMFYSNDAQLRAITFWNLGSVGSATWGAVAAVAPCAVVGLAVAPFYARRLDLLALGERSARHLGVDVEGMRRVLIVVVALLTSAAVAFSGVIGFVGLVVPHLIRMIAGPGHRTLIAASTLGGAVLLVGADLIARTVAAPAEVPLGVLTALIGAPFFFWLLRRTRSRQGGWA
ncbi:iron ABC transporter permease [Allokutzneria sp. NRRL B-24872]|uniref:FecCD family ABC transporter permease n=1 Tax=Allokutzneria sp. NRRL B-24872 TaxID=1137961 RepID=UPI000A39C19C|nr:iron ABC transporter permease [Allokutzneria sp. NRRL B-24872]